jgi:hypothetical protein
VCGTYPSTSPPGTSYVSPRFIFPNYTLTPCFTGHGTVLFVIICIETSIGIICGCLPGCKPLFTKLFPSVFANSTNANSHGRSNGKKPSYPSSKSADGQSFPFQIVEEKAFDVQYGEGASSKMGSSSNPKAHRDDDGDSGEWIMMQSSPRINTDSV